MNEKQKKILAIDDNPDNLIVLRVLLANSFPEAQFLGAESGASGIELCLSAEPDVILLDILMPGMDGYDVCRILKSNEQTSIIPVIMFTAAQTDKMSRLRALEAGADAFLTKPLEETELRVQLRAMLRLKESEDHNRSEKMRLTLQVAERTFELEQAHAAMSVLLEDLTKENDFRRKIEVELRQSEQKYRSIFENIQDVYYEISLEGFILEISPSIEIISRNQYHRKELIGKSIADFYISSDDRTSFLSQLMDQGEVRDYELAFLNSDGSIMPSLISAKLYFDSEGRPEKIIGSMHDISKRKKAEEALIISEQRFMQVAESSGVWVWEVDTEGMFVYAGSSKETIFGYDACDIIGKKYFYDFFVPEQKAELKKVAFEAMARKEAFTNFENTNIHKNGHRIILETSGLPILNEQGGLIGYRGADTDITLRKKAEQALSESNAFNLSLLKSIPFGMDIVDNEGNILFVNDKLKERIGSDGRGQKCWDLYRDAKTQCENCPLLSVIDPDHTSVIESKDVLGGRTFQIIHTGMVFEGKKAILEIFQDFTELQENRVELLNAKNKAEENNRLKSAFLSNMSHEIRTPMNAILGFSGLIPDADDEEKNLFAEIVHNSSLQLLQLIDDVILLSRLQSEKMTVYSAEFSPARLVSDIRKMFMLPDMNKGLTILVNIPDNARNLFIHSDEKKIRQVLTNLAANAVKYTPEGSVEIGFRDRQGAIEFYVKDTGIGISEKEQHQIFESFYRGEAAISSAIGGSGLGLNIAKELVELIGGKLEVISEINRGSCFYFTVPSGTAIPEVSKQQEVQIPPEYGKDFSILIADDEPNNFLYLNILLKKAVGRTDHAANGEEAVEMASKNRYDLILMDLKMPVMGGIEAARILKVRFPELPVIAVTAYAMQEEKENALNAGFDDFITKPVRKEILLEKIRRYMHSPGGH